MDGRDLPDPLVARAMAVPLRRRILELVYAAEGEVTVAELTAVLGCNHNSVRHHLTRLRDAGLVHEALEQRSRPGRPRLLYSAAPPAADPQAAPRRLPDPDPEPEHDVTDVHTEHEAVPVRPPEGSHRDETR